MYKLSSDKVHYRWKSSIEPVLNIRSGETVEIETRDGFDGQTPAGTTKEQIENVYETIDFRRVAPLTGPIYVDGAEPGDVLEVDIKEIVPTDVGTTVIFPSWMEADFLFQEMRKDFPNAYIKHFDVVRHWKEGSLPFAPGIQIPVRLMMGMMGTAPRDGDFVTLTPREFGGNLDSLEVTTGNKLFLPVFQRGALFSTGDGHAAQGDGETCSTGVECAMKVTCRFTVRKNMKISEPMIETPNEYITISNAKTLDEATQKAIRYMVEFLSDTRGLTKHESLMLVGLAGDLKINQVVDFPHRGVSMRFPKKVFSEENNHKRERFV